MVYRYFRYFQVRQCPPALLALWAGWVQHTLAIPGPLSAAGTGCSWGSTQSRELRTGRCPLCSCNSGIQATWAWHMLLTASPEQDGAGWGSFCRTHQQAGLQASLSPGRAAAAHPALCEQRPTGLSVGLSYQSVTYGTIHGLKAKSWHRLWTNVVFSRHYHVCAWMQAKMHKPS